MKVCLSWVEKYPEPYLRTGVAGRFETEIEIPDEEYADWLRVKNEYDLWSEKWGKMEDATLLSGGQKERR